ncbi:MAG: hypothetical protein NTV22_01150 [bacterium]|nr:hypothetical protein [bacterium]
MGDRTWVTITVAQKDTATLLNIFEFSMANKENLNVDEHDGMLDITLDEMNYLAKDCRSGIKV